MELCEKYSLSFWLDPDYKPNPMWEYYKKVKMHDMIPYPAVSAAVFRDLHSSVEKMKEAAEEWAEKDVQN